MNKKIFAILIVLIFALSISTVSATGVEDYEDVHVDLTQDTPSHVDVTSDNGPGSFTDLQNIINGAEKESTVELTKNYTYSDKDKDIKTINIDKNLIIDGKGHTIDASNKASVFTIAEGKEVTIKNIIFINGKSTNGGAIYNNGVLNVGEMIAEDTQVTFNNGCNFINNSATNDGGAIYNNGVLSIYASAFINNSAVNGGAFNNNVASFVLGCSFINNSATDGGAINDNGNKYMPNSFKISGDLILLACEFINNSAVNGGVIYNSDSLKVNLADSIFINNSATNDGGVIYNNAHIFINGECSFINNSAVNGGAIYNKYNDGELTLYCIGYFINNSAVNGGAIYNNITVDNSNIRLHTYDALYFINNSATNDGGAIYNNDGYVMADSLYICINNVASNRGGAIYNNDLLSVNGGTDHDTHSDAGSNFTDNSAIDGGAIYNNGNLTVSGFRSGDTSFTDNSATNMGGAIYNNGNLTVTGSIFINNKASFGADIVADTESDIKNIPEGIVIGYITSIAIDPIDKIAVGEGFTVSGTTTSIPEGADIVISVNGKDYDATVSKDNTFSKEINGITQEGTAKVVVSYVGNDTVSSSNGAINVTVGRDTSVITFDDITAIVGEEITVSGTTLPKDAKITITVDGKEISVTAKEGKFSANIGKFTKAGDYTIVAKYDGNDDYIDATVSKEFTVMKKSTSMAMDDDIKGTAGDIVIEGTVDGIPDKAVITVNIAGKTYDGAVNGSKFSVAVKDLAAGNYNITASYAGNDDYGPANASAKLNLTQIATSIAMDDLNILPGQNANITGNVTGIPDKATVTVSVDGKDYTAKVNGSKFSVIIEDLALGSYNVTATYKGNITYEASNASAILTVRKLNSSITINPIGKIDVGDNITVSGNTAGIANNTEIIIIVNGKEYTTKVVNNTFSEKINDVTPEGTGIVIVYYDGNATVNSAEANITIIVGRESTIIDLDYIYAVVGEDVIVSGTIIPKDAKITITVDGKEFNVTAEDGEFYENIGKFNKVGNHTIVVKYGGDEDYTNATVSEVFTVVKKSTYIYIPDIKDIAGDIVIEGFTYGIRDNSTIRINVGDRKCDAKVNGSKFSVTVKGLAAGNYTIKANYIGNNEYAPANTTAELNLTQIATSIAIPNVNVGIADNIIINGTVTGIPDNSTIKVSIGGKIYTPKVNGSKFSVKVNGLALGSYNITAVYEGTVTYKAASANATLNVTKHPTVLSIVDITDVLDAGDKLIINATLTSNGKPVKGAVELLINGRYVAKANVVNGYVLFNVTPYAGEVTVMLRFAGDNKYEGSNATYDIIVNGMPATLTVPDVTIFFNNGTQLIIDLTSNGDRVSNEQVIINVNGKNYTRTIINGTAKFDINLAPGEYDVTVSLFSYKYDFVSTNAVITVLPVIKGNDTVLFFQNGTRYVALFLDGQGKPLEGANVEFNINGVFYYRTTDENGEARLTINLAPGNYTITVKNTDINAVHSNNITVLPVIKGKDTVLFFQNGTRYVALFLDGQGKPLVDADVQFNINGVFYDRITGRDGTAGLTINLAPGSYIITAINTDNGALHSNNITVLPTIISEDVVKYYKNETQYNVKVVDGKGHALAKQTVEYNINGVFYYRTTNANGVAVFKINLAAGNSEPQDYIITATCNGCIVSNNVTVLPVLTAEDFNEPYGTNKKFTAKIVNGKGKPLAGARIQFNLNGSVYNKTSDINGIAGLNIKLVPGEYLITTTCINNGAVISNNVTITQ